MEGTYVSQTVALVSRELKHWYRSKTQILTVIIQPMIWLLLFGSAMTGYIGSVSNQDTIPGGYFTFLALGMVIITVLFSSMNAGMTLIWDRRFGFLDKIRAAPIPRGAIPLSKVIAATIKATIQAVLVLTVALIYHPSMVDGLTAVTVIVSVLTILLCAACTALTVSSVFVAMGLVIRNQEVLLGVTVLLNLPLMFASGAMFPTSTFPWWLKLVANGNPLTYATDAIRQAWGLPNNLISMPDIALQYNIMIVVIIAFLVTLGGVFFARRALRGD